MKSLLLFALMLSSSFVFAQDHQRMDNSKGNDKGEITVTGCVSRSGGDYTLIKQNPAMTYQLQGSHKIRLHDYLGQRVEVSGQKSPTMSTSSDEANRMGSASPVTITVDSIKTIDKECPERPTR